MDEVLTRHRKEQKELLAVITNLKKQALKKTRKSVNSKCADLQRDLDQKQEAEKREAAGEDQPELEEAEITPEQLLATLNLETNASGETPLSEQTVTRLAPKRNRAKERLAKREAEIASIRAQAQEEAENSIDYRALEIESMKRILQPQHLELHEIQPDGHCLFSLIKDQLEQRQAASGVSVLLLRSQAAEFIRKNADDFAPYLFDELTMSLRDVNTYTKELETTAMWGSDMEILALARVYDCAVKVLIAGSAPLVFNENAQHGPLTIAYLKHTYGLGEHYDSCRDAA